MAHHGFDQAEQMRRLVKELSLGPTGHYPDGALNETDEGEIRIAVGVEQGKVVISFGKPTAWIGFTYQQARDLAELLIKHSDRAQCGG